MAPLDRSYMSFLFVFHCNYGSILYRLHDKARDICRKSRFFHIHVLHINYQPPLPLGKNLRLFMQCFFHNRARSLEYLVVQLNSAKSPLFTQSIRALRHGQTDRRK